MSKRRHGTPITVRTREGDVDPTLSPPCYLRQAAAEQLVHAFNTSKLDYYNALLCRRSWQFRPRLECGHLTTTTTTRSTAQ